MTTYNTGNPLGSVDVRDLYDNAQNTDLLTSGTSPAYPDRLGVSRKSWKGMELDFAAFLAASGFELPAIEYTGLAPLVIDRPTQLIFRTGLPDIIYSVKPTESFPVTLTGTWATDEARLVVRVDGDLRQDLAATTGSAIVGYGMRTVSSRLSDAVHVKDFGAAGDGVTDDTAAIEAALEFAATRGCSVELSGFDYKMSAPVPLIASINGGDAKILVDGAYNGDLFIAEQQSNLFVRDMKFDTIGANIKRAYAIKLLNGCDNIKLSNIETLGYYSGLITDRTATNNNAVIKLAFTNTATGGTWKVGMYKPGQTGEPVWTPALPYNVTAVALQSALNSALGGTGVTVAGGPAPGAPFTVTFGGDYAGLYVQPLMTFVSPTGQQEWGAYSEVITNGDWNWNSRISVDTFIARDSGIYGFEYNFVQGLTMRNCAGLRSWFDGIKLRSNVQGVDIFGGDFSYNGQSWFSPSPNQFGGDGMDVYAGGEDVRVFGGRWSHNAGSGILIKNDDSTDLTGYGDGKFGMAKRIDLFGIEACHNLVANGVTITSNKAAATSYVVDGVNIIGGSFNGNAVYGIFSNCAQNITIDSVRTERNGSIGIGIARYADGVEINAPKVIANGNGLGTGTGIFLDGRNTVVRGGTIRSTGSDGMTPSTDRATLVAQHSASISVGANAVDVTVDMVDERGATGARPIISNSAATRVLIHQRPEVVPSSLTVYGSQGSTVTTQDGKTFVKVAGADAGQVGLWRRSGGREVLLATVTQTLQNQVDTVLIDPAAGDVFCTLPPLVSSQGAEVQVTRNAAAGNRAVIRGAAGDRINEFAPAASYDLAADGNSVTLLATPTRWVIIGKVV